MSRSNGITCVLSNQMTAYLWTLKFAWNRTKIIGVIQLYLNSLSTCFELLAQFDNVFVLIIFQCFLASLDSTKETHLLCFILLLMEVERTLSRFNTPGIILRFVWLISFSCLYFLRLKCQLSVLNRRFIVYIVLRGVLRNLKM